MLKNRDIIVAIRAGKFRVDSVTWNQAISPVEMLGEVHPPVAVAVGHQHATGTFIISPTRAHYDQDGWGIQWSADDIRQHNVPLGDFMKAAVEEYGVEAIEAALTTIRLGGEP